MRTQLSLALVAVQLLLNEMLVVTNNNNSRTPNQLLVALRVLISRWTELYHEQ